MRCELRRDYRFESARRLTGIGDDHPCARVHGHSFAVEVTVEGEVREPEGWVMDFAAIDAVFDPLIAELDHRLLNEVADLSNPTSEHLARWLWTRASAGLPELRCIRVAETDRSAVSYRGE